MIQEEIRQWIREISVKRPELNGFAVCPFAEGASYKIIFSKISGVAPIEGCDVAIFIVEDYLSSEKLRFWREKLNDTYSEYEFLEDGRTYLFEGYKNKFWRCKPDDVPKKGPFSENESNFGEDGLLFHVGSRGSK
jgi:hypothetical protein